MKQLLESVQTSLLMEKTGYTNLEDLTTLSNFGRGRGVFNPQTMNFVVNGRPIEVKLHFGHTTKLCAQTSYISNMTFIIYIGISYLYPL